jgi:hypothetical protein
MFILPSIQACVSTLAAKYLFKYVTKGVDRTMVRVQGEHQRDEIKEFQDRRSIGAAEAVWRLFAYQISERFPAVYALRVHMPEKQIVYFQPGDMLSTVKVPEKRSLPSSLRSTATIEIREYHT